MMNTVMNMKQYTSVTVLRSVLIALFILTAAIAVPILCRGFYYAHIDALELAEKTPWSREEIVAAYDEVLDYCTGRADFGTGVLKSSAEGQAHFADVRVLFILDLVLAAASLLLLVLTVCLREKPLRGHSSAFWGSVGLLAVLCVTAFFAALDFDRAFEMFHALFFPGKTNWLFDAATDEIIRVLPQEFFRNCAILIFAIVLLACALCIAFDIKKKRALK